MEELALSRSDAGSWLGLHLRRVDAFTDAGERRRFEMAANARTAAEVDWGEAAGTLSPEDLTSRTEAVLAYVAATDPASIARRRQDLTVALDNATRAETEARSTLLGDLDSYGIVPGHLAGQDLRKLPALVDQRVAAGRVARRLMDLGELEVKEAKAAARLTELLEHLGHTEGPLEARLGRVIEAIADARNRTGQGDRPRATVVRPTSPRSRRSSPPSGARAGPTRRTPPRPPPIPTSSTPVVATSTRCSTPPDASTWSAPSTASSSPAPRWSSSKPARRSWHRVPARSSSA